MPQRFTGTVRAADPADAPAVAGIYNQGVEDRCATFEVRPRSADEMRDQIAGATGGFPFLVADLAGRVVGWASVSRYRPRECYRGVGELSVYVAREARDAGVGRALLEALVGAARRAGYWKLVGRIFTFNQASLTLCRRAGFRSVGVYRRHAQLDGQWLDVAVVERLIPENQL
jgi:phosphinothricin acetyltransferase